MLPVRRALLLPSPLLVFPSRAVNHWPDSSARVPFLFLAPPLLLLFRRLLYSVYHSGWKDPLRLWFWEALEAVGRQYVMVGDVFLGANVG